MGLNELVVMCQECTQKELSGNGLSSSALDYDEYYCSNGLEFFGCPHLSVVEKEIKIGA